MDIDWGTKVITVYRDTDTFFTPVGGGVYDMDTDEFRKQLRDAEDSEDGIAFPDTHTHNTEVTLSGATYARQVVIVNGYTITFLPDTSWGARLVGSNNNIGDVKNVNSVSLIIQNSAGLIAAPIDTSTIVPGFWEEVIENGLTAEEMWRLMMSAMVGKVSGANTSQMSFRDDADSKDRIVVDVDVYGNRLGVTKDGS